ncbi:unnamed protein product [Cyclocybe aegerita]|uniref:Uncharacterized protein n=1 Tax=Cyclocybe aegerita TaxID=1973307 RepID=A0A8S0WTQ6_CYCAE|nr:unnamed protein product [Cyclocybe aegerita]
MLITISLLLPPANSLSASLCYSSLPVYHHSLANSLIVHPSLKFMLSRFAAFWSPSMSESKATTTSGKPKTSISHSATALKTLRTIGNLSRAETLRDAATEVTAVLETLITTKHIDHDFQQLGQEICGLIIIIATEYEETPASQDLQVSIGEISRHIASLKTLCRKYSHYPRWKTFPRRRYGRGRVAELRSGVADIAHRVSGKNKLEALDTLELWNEENAAAMKHLEELMTWLQKTESKNNEQPFVQNLSVSDEQSKDQPEIPSSSTPARGILRPTGDNVPARPASDVPETPYPTLESAGGECDTVAPSINTDSAKLELELPKTNIEPFVPTPSPIRLKANHQRFTSTELSPTQLSTTPRSSVIRTTTTAVMQEQKTSRLSLRRGRTLRSSILRSSAIPAPATTLAISGIQLWTSTSALQQPLPCGILVSSIQRRIYAQSRRWYVSNLQLFPHIDGQESFQSNITRRELENLVSSQVGIHSA